MIVKLSSLLIVAAILTATASARQTPSFEVASVQRTLAAPGPFRNVVWLPGGRMTATGLTLKELIRSAYVADGIQLMEQIVGGPDWIHTDRFDIVAKLPAQPEVPPAEANQQRAAMLKALLADRFKLHLHGDTRELPVFDLLLAEKSGKPGPQLTVSTCARSRTLPSQTGTTVSGPCVPFRLVGMNPGSGMTMRAEGITMSELASALVGFPEIGRPVRDRTGLAGAFDVQLTFPVGAAQGRASGPPDPGAITDTGVFTVLREQLGLKLEGHRDQVDVIVIDSAEPPAED